MPDREHKAPPRPAGPVFAGYRALVDAGTLKPDPAQDEAARLLDTVAQGFEDKKARSGFLSRLTRSGKQPVQGAYVWGPVGGGKTLLMDLFFEHVPLRRKRRVHFHAFMDEVHTAIAAYRAGDHDDAGRRDPIPEVTRPIVQSTTLLCLDEFHVHDITNAMLLQRLFERLFAGRVTLVATSNVPPERLYWNGLNRQLFLPFIGLLQDHVTVLPLKAEQDYRLGKFHGQEVFAFAKEGRTRMDALFTRLTGGHVPSAGAVESLGRQIAVPEQAMGVARFPFADLCEAPLGARDYLRLVHAYDSFVVDDIPRFGPDMASPAKRFILFVDTLYDRGGKLCASFAVPLQDLFADGENSFEAERCVSRLIEMQSDAYLDLPLRSEAAE